MIRSNRRRAAKMLALLAALAVFTVTGTSSAQRYVAAGTFESSTGMAGGGGDTTSLERAPTRLRIGGDVHVDEEPESAIGIAGLVDLEPRARFGADIRYIRLVDERFALSAGGVGYMSPTRASSGRRSCT